MYDLLDAWRVLRLMSTRLSYVDWRTVHSSWPVWLVWSARYSFRGITWHWITGMTLTQWFGVTLTQITIRRSSGFQTTSGSPLTLELSHVGSWFGSDLSVFQQHYCLCCISPWECRGSYKHLFILCLSPPATGTQGGHLNPWCRCHVHVRISCRGVWTIFSEGFEILSHSATLNFNPFPFLPLIHVVMWWHHDLLSKY